MSNSQLQASGLSKRPIASTPKSRFLSLPFDIRNEIYHLLLVANKLTIVYSYPPTTGDSSGNFSHGDFAKIQTRLDCLPVAILRVNKTVRQEATPILYRSNTFSFIGTGPRQLGLQSLRREFREYRRPEMLDVPWDPFYTFLDMIGLKNRSLLRNLEVEIGKPMQITRQRDGKLQLLQDVLPYQLLPLRPVPKDRYPRCHPPTIVETTSFPTATLDYCSPLIEECFRLLGPAGAYLKVDLIMTPGTIPGVTLYRPFHRGHRLYTYLVDATGWEVWSLEIQDLVELLRRKYTAHDGKKGRADVLWTGWSSKSPFDAHQKGIHKEWDVVEVKDVEHNDHLTSRNTQKCMELQFVLRRKYFRGWKATATLSRPRAEEFNTFWLYGFVLKFKPSPKGQK